MRDLACITQNRHILPLFLCSMSLVVRSKLCPLLRSKTCSQLMIQHIVVDNS